MKRDDAILGSSNAIDLAREIDFYLGSLLVRPSTCQVLVGGRLIDLQPKIMQVFLALAHAQGRAISREELLAVCWNGVHVGDDSIHRCIGRLRRLSEIEAPGVFSIITQPKVGYRLVLADPLHLSPNPKAPEDAAQHSRRFFARKRRLMVIGFATLLLIATATTVLFLRPANSSPYRIAVRDFQRDGVEAKFADSLEDRIAAAVSDRHLPIVARSLGDHAAFGRARFLVGGTIKRKDDLIEVNIRLDDAVSGLTLWTRTLSRPMLEADALQDQVAVKIADLMDLMRHWIDVQTIVQNPAAVAALFEALDAMRGNESSTLQTQEAFRRFLELAPNSSRANSGFAMASALGSSRQTKEIAAQWRSMASAAAHKAISLDAKNGEGYLALGVLTPSDDLRERETWYLKGLAADPNDASLPNFLAGLLSDVGRLNDAEIWYNRSLVLDPLSPPKTADMIDALSNVGQFGDAQSLILRSERLFPDAIELQRVILFNRLIYAKPQDARSALDHFQHTARPLPDQHAQLWRNFESIRMNGKSAYKPDVGLSTIDNQVGRDELSARIAGLALIGDIEGAFYLIEQASKLGADFKSSTLFAPATQSLREDRRFAGVVSNMDFVRYWRLAKRKPDFCAQRPIAAFCS